MQTISNKSAIKSLALILISSSLALWVVSERFQQEDLTGSVNSDVEKASNLSSANLAATQQLRFVENQGQAGLSAKYHVQGAGHTVLFHEDKVVLRRDEAVGAKNEIVLQFNGANQNPEVSGREKLPGVAHFYKGQNPEQWHTNVPTYESVIYSELYPGIDMAYIGNDGKLESEFYVSPGVDFRQIRISYNGVKAITIRDDGALALTTEIGELIERRPFAYQNVDGARKEIDAEYVLLADASVGFELGGYDHERPLVIDPELVFLSTIPGGPGGGEWAGDVVIDNDNNVILSGGANRFFPAADSIAGSNHVGGSSSDGLLVKLDGTTGAVIYSALFGGSRLDYFNELAIDPSGNLYLTGLTKSSDFPVLNALQDTLAGAEDAFMTILDATGALTYSTYIGGTLRDWGEGITLDDSGNVYIGGSTESDDFPTTAGFQSTFQGGSRGSAFPADNFVAKFTAQGDLVYATYLGGSGDDRFQGLTANSSGQVTVAGNTLSSDFPMMNAYQDTLGGIKWGIGDITVTKLNSSGTGLIYSTYIGGAIQDWATDIASGINGEVYVSGGTSSSNFPVINGLSAPEADTSDGVLISLNKVGQPVYSVRTNSPGFDAFAAVGVHGRAVAYPVGSWGDSTRVYVKSIDSALSVHFAFAAPGHKVNSAYLFGEYMAFANVFFAASPATSSATGNANNLSLGSSPSLAGSALSRLISKGLWIAAFNNSALNLDYDFGDGILALGAQQDGNTTVNGENTGVPTEEVVEVNIKGSDGDEEVDLSGMMVEYFTNLTLVAIVTGGGSDLVFATVLNNINLLVNAGAGVDQIYVALWISYVNAIINGGLGSDMYTFLSQSNSQQLSPTPANPGAARYAVAPVTVVDSGGVDTLNFANYGMGVTLDLEAQQTAQTIDTSGTQIVLDGMFEVVRGSASNDEITLAPLAGVPRHFDGGSGTDVLNIAPASAQSVDDGSTIRTPGFADITYSNIETVNLPIVTGIGDDDKPLPFNFSLNQNYPNPFNPSTVISYSIPTKSEVTIGIYNVLGQQIALFSQGQQSAGEYSVTWSSTDKSGVSVASGMYFYKITAGDFTASRKMVLLK